ncbi:MAG: hypothetical protein ACIAXF_14200 [Phycisphaerales bacterium JB063]
MSDEQKFRTMDWIIGLGITVSLSLAGWSMTQVVDHGNRIAVIEDSRFTDADARMLKDEIVQSVQTPRWIEERFNLIAEQNKEISRQLTEIQRRLQVQP